MQKSTFFKSIAFFSLIIFSTPISAEHKENQVENAAKVFGLGYTHGATGLWLCPFTWIPLAMGCDDPNAKKLILPFSLGWGSGVATMYFVIKKAHDALCSHR